MKITYMNMVISKKFPRFWQLKTSKIIFIKKIISHFNDILLVKDGFLLLCLMVSICLDQYCACKWFGTYIPCKCKSHNEIYLHSVQVYNIHLHSFKGKCKVPKV